MPRRYLCRRLIIMQASGITPHDNKITNSIVLKLLLDFFFRFLLLLHTPGLAGSLLAGLQVVCFYHLII